MNHPDKQFLDYLKLAGNFSGHYPFLDTAIYTLLISLNEDKKKRRIFIYKIKYLLFPIYVFYKYFNLKNLFKSKIIPQFPDASILAIIHGSGPQHYGDLVRIIDELLKNDQKIIVALGSVSLKQKNYLKSLENIYLIDQISAVYNIKLKEIINHILSSYKFFASLLREVEVDRKLWNVIKSNKGFVLDQFFICLCHYNYSQRILENNSIKIVFSSNDGNYFSRGYFIHSNSMGIENLMFHHGLSDKLHLKTIANRIVMWSKSEIDFFIYHGFEVNRLLPYGLPRFDNFINAKINQDYNLSNLYNLDSGSKLCFFYTLHDNDTCPTYNRIYISEINTIAPILNKKGYNIFIRAHPNDDIKEYSKVLTSEAKKVITLLPNDFPLDNLIRQMDLCVFNLSAAIIEAVLSNVPIIFMNYDHYWDQKEDFFNLRSVYRKCQIIKEFELISIIERILDDKKVRSDLLEMQNTFREDNILNLGFATKKITAYILNHCQ